MVISLEASRFPSADGFNSWMYAYDRILLPASSGNLCSKMSKVLLQVTHQPTWIGKLDFYQHTRAKLCVDTVGDNRRLAQHEHVLI